MDQQPIYDGDEGMDSHDEEFGRRGISTEYRFRATIDILYLEHLEFGCRYNSCESGRIIGIVMPHESGELELYCEDVERRCRAREEEAENKMWADCVEHLLAEARVKRFVAEWRSAVKKNKSSAFIAA